MTQAGRGHDADAGLGGLAFDHCRLGERIQLLPPVLDQQDALEEGPEQYVDEGIHNIAITNCCPSSSWRLFVEYLTRAGEVMPAEGVPFTAIVTISDPDVEQPVFNDMRQNLQALGVQIADIRTAARITPRV